MSVIDRSASKLDNNSLVEILDVAFVEEIEKMMSSRKIKQITPVHLEGTIRWSAVSYCLHRGYLEKFKLLLGNGELKSDSVDTILEVIILTMNNHKIIIDLLDNYDIIVNVYHLRLLLSTTMNIEIIKYILNRLNPKNVETNFMDTPEYVVCFINPDEDRCIEILKWRIKKDVMRFVKNVCAYSLINGWHNVINYLDQNNIKCKSLDRSIKLENQMNVNE